MNKEVFLKLMKDYKQLIDDIDNVHNAMKKLDPDFGGFCISRVEEFCSKVIKLSFDDKFEWISYYMYDLEWGKKYKKGSVTDKNGKNIPLKTLEDLYKLLTESKEEE
jgi:hypothetical protein